MLNLSKNIILLLVIAFVLLMMPYSLATVQDNYPVVGKMETVLFGMTSPSLKISDRISAIEKNIFGKTYQGDSLYDRTERLKLNVLGSSEDLRNVEEEAVGIEQPLVNQKTKPQNESSYENLQTTEITPEQFVETFSRFLNEERSYKGLLPLVSDTLASNVAHEQAREILLKNYLSYSNSKNQYPDERYTLAGGTGAILEVIKGFEKNPKEKKIKLTELLAMQLLDAIKDNQDDTQILFSPYINHFGFGFAFSDDKRRFSSVVEFVTKGGDFEPIKPVVTLNEKLRIMGKVNHPYKFKAISVAYYDVSRLNLEDSENLGYFSNDYLKPYFPPQDYIAYSNIARSNFVKVLKGIGVIGAIGAAPFTGGATAILAPALISSIQNGPPKEIPLKGGVKVNSKGEFASEVELNYQGKGGLYYISVLAELSGVSFPIVISRRTVRVNRFLPAAYNHEINNKNGI